MGRWSITFAAVIVLAAATGLACSDDGTGGDTNAASEREEFIQDVEDRLSELQSDLEQARDDLASGDATQEAEQRVEDLEQRIDEIESELEQVRNASDDEWEALKEDLEETMRDAEDLAGEIGSELGVN
jgi:chromosome segregation ATPase